MKIQQSVIYVEEVVYIVGNTSSLMKHFHKQHAINEQNECLSKAAAVPSVQLVHSLSLSVLIVFIPLEVA